MHVNIISVSAFTIDGKGGNKAGLVMDPGTYSRSQKQKIAAKAGFSEIAFVSPSEIADFKLEFFTPVCQIPHCGHATIAAFSYLKSTGLIEGDHSSKETIDGIREIFFDGNMVFMQQQPGKHQQHHNIGEIAASLKINTAQLQSLPVIVNTGNSFMLIELGSEDELREVDPNFDLIAEISQINGLTGFYLYVRTPGKVWIATTRMFAPLYGIKEEAATGTAAGPLAWWLYKENPEAGNAMLIRQGELMKIPSASNLEVLVNRANSKVPNLFVGGYGTH